jgi:hypothetical protein
LRQRRAADVVDGTGRLHPYAVALPVQSPAQVDLFHVHLEPLVEPADGFEGRAPEAEGRPGGPEDVARIVVLPAVAFHRVDDTAAGKGVAEAVEEAPRGAGVLEPIAVVVLQEFRLHGAHVRIPLHHVDERAEPSRRDLHVVVQQHNVLACGVRNGRIVAARKQPVFGMAHDLHRWKLGGHPRRRSVRGPIVRQHNFKVRIVRRNH